MVERDAVESALSEQRGNASFERALEEARTPERLVRLLANYIYFNATFGAGVANLAGEIGQRKGLFRSPEEPVWFLADRSMEVAADIFSAAIDEFDDRSTAQRDTHRALASATLKGTAQFLGYDASQLSAAGAILGTTLVAVEGVRGGYAVGRAVDEVGLFRGLGFHLGSELLADGEFRLLDTFLRAHWPELQAYLAGSEIAIDGQPHNAYWWVQIHTRVEADHFEHAVRAVNRALALYAGDRSPEAVYAGVLEGVGGFAQVQAAFMTGLREG